ncbi:MAG: hypothetical protein O3C69_04025 [Chloroflexi bacterium]|nr:hypothetical protein [Chloroflexota bacterium]
MIYATPYDYNEASDIEEMRQIAKPELCGDPEQPASHWCLGGFNFQPCSIHGHLTAKVDLVRPAPPPPTKPQEVSALCPDCFKAMGRCMCYLGDRYD